MFRSRRGQVVYRRPVEIVQALALEEVVPCLEHVETRVEQGLHAAGFLSYEAAPALDPALVAHPPGDLPLLWFGLYDGPDTEGFEPKDDAYALGPWQACVSEEAYRETVDRLRRYIAAGDTYQVNYTFPLEAQFRGDAGAWFRRLCEAQQADHCAYVNTGRFQVVSASPELHFRLERERLETRPMKGTRRRGRWLEEDRAEAEALAGSEKDRAENVMIVDLLRNDMGRISEVGSVEVARLFEVERYETVWQMTSTVVSRTRASVPAILGALFPSGSVTGAPKVRTMQIIREVEPHPRGVYCGSIGRWLPGRRAEFSVAIRTAVVDASIGRARYSVGGGITWGSTPGGEYEEALLKAAVLGFRRPFFELLESIRYDDGYFLLEEHLDRLCAGAEYFGFRFDAGAVRAALDAAAAAFAERGPLKVRLLLGRDGVPRIEAEPAKPPTPVRLGWAREPVDENDVFLFHKTTQREVYRRAKEGRPDCDDVLLWNRAGEITESTVANVVLEIDGRRLTPAIGCGLLAGTFRARLLKDGEVREAVLRKENLSRARSIYLINSVRKWIPVEWVP